MVTFIDLLQLVYDELKAVVSANTSVSNPDDHVDVLDRQEDYATPFFGFEWQINPNSQGMGGNVRNGATATDTDGDVTSVEKIRDYVAFIDVGVVLDGDKPHLRDEYLVDVQDHFSGFVDDTDALHADIHRVREDGALPSGGGDDRDIGYRISYRIEFHTATTADIPGAKNVSWDVDADGSDAYPEQY